MQIAISHSRRRRSSPWRGFTLIELLVLIAIIAILASLLLPALSRAKLKVKQVNCINNLKQMIIANTMYISDFNKGLPYYPYDPTYYGTLWMGTRIRYHAQVNQVRLCPSAPETKPAPTGTTWGTAESPWAWASTPLLTGSYGFNGWFYSDDAFFNSGTDADRHFVRDQSVQYPSQTPVFVDSIWVDLWPRPADMPATDLYHGSQSGGIGAITRRTIARHGGRPPGSAPQNFPINQSLPGSVDLALIDGHVESTPLERL
jgi:prepilin-type N-terminal cleavage/methylation domain-containing protein